MASPADRTNNCTGDSTILIRSLSHRNVPVRGTSNATSRISPTMCGVQKSHRPHQCYVHRASLFAKVSMTTALEHRRRRRKHERKNHCTSSERNIGEPFAKCWHGETLPDELESPGASQQTTIIYPSYVLLNTNFVHTTLRCSTYDVDTTSKRT